MQQWQVHDVMSRQVVTATPDTTLGQLARLLATHRINAIPIVDDDGGVLGVVSEADLLSTVVASGAGHDRAVRRRGAVRSASTAHEIMTIRPVTIAADAPLSAAAAELQARKVKRLLVTDEAGRLLGVVSRADVLRPLTRPDAAIREDVIEQVLRQILWIDPRRVHVDVHDGVVTLSGAVGRRTTAGIAARLTRQVPGVVDVVNHVRYDFDDAALARSRVSRTHPFSAEPFHPAWPARTAA
jgi:CBS domain-containing protein